MRNRRGVKMLLPAVTATNKALALFLELCVLCIQMPWEWTFTQAKFQASMIVQSRYLLLTFNRALGTATPWSILRSQVDSSPFHLEQLHSISVLKCTRKVWRWLQNINTSCRSLCRSSDCIEQVNWVYFTHYFFTTTLIPLESLFGYG